MSAPADAESNRPRFSGLRARLLFALALALAPVLAIVGFQTEYSYREAVARSQDELLVSALSAGQGAKSTIEKGRTVLTTLQSLRAVRNGGEPCQEALQEVNQSLLETTNVVLAGWDGKVICSAQPVPEDYSAKGEAWFQSARRGRAFVISPLGASPLGNEPVLVLATPAPGVYGRGVLALTIRVRAIDRGGATSPRGPSPDISLADQTGQLIARARTPGPTSIPVDWIKRAERERGFVGFERRLDGKRGNVAVAPLVGEDIFVVMSSPTPTLVAWTRLDVIGRLIVPLAMFVLAVAVVWWGGDQLVLRWVRDLRGLANAYAQGDYLAKPPADDKRAPEELQELRRALIDMAGAIAARDTTLKDALEEKQTLLREVHHRVKNNLQIMVSLFNMQLRTLGDDEGRRALEEARARVTALALVHQALYEGEDLRTIDLGEFIENLVRALIDAAGGAARRVDLSVRVTAAPQPASVAVPLALFVVEAATNALKHAFPEDREGVIEIEVAEESGTMRVTISDDGIGIDPRRPAERTGVSLMNAFARQLRGQSCMSSRPGGGARVELTFPLTAPAEIE
jgi:two-component sensor histidine kinase